jgi:hypothetical protein
MGRRKVRPGRVTAKQACAWAQLDYETYRKLVRDQCLSKSPPDGVDVDYFVALYAFARLAVELGFDEIRRVWPQIRAEMPPEDELTAPYLKVLVRIPMPTAKILRSADELDRAMSDGRGARALDLSPGMKAARDFFERVVNGELAGQQPVQRRIRVMPTG